MTDAKVEVTQIKIRINELRKELLSINEERKKWSDKKRDIYNSISTSVKTLKEHRQKRNSLTKQVRKSKKERDDLNAKIKTLIEEIKKLNSNKSSFVKEHSIKEDPKKIRENIDALEFKIETEALSFEKEKQMMKLIHEKQKLLKEAKGLTEVVDNISKLSREIDDLKKKAKEKHDAMQKHAKDSQDHHEKMINLSEGLKNRNEKDKETYDKVVEYQAKVDTVNAELEKHLLVLKQATEKYMKVVNKKKADKKKKIEEVLKEKDEAVEEKIKKGKKLTTQDLLVFQRKGL